jgi:hypothetical protein
VRAHTRRRALTGPLGYCDAVEELNAEEAVTPAPAPSQDGTELATLSPISVDLADTANLSSVSTDVVSEEDIDSFQAGAPSLYKSVAEATGDNNHDTAEYLEPIAVAPVHVPGGILHEDWTSDHSQASKGDDEDNFDATSPLRTLSTGVEVVSLRPLTRRGAKGPDLGLRSRGQRRTHSSTSEEVSVWPTSVRLATVPPQGYRRPVRLDTEARIGFANPASSTLFNAVQDQPQSLLSRLIRQDLFDVPEVKGVLFTYIVAIILLQVALAVLTDGFATLVFVGLALVRSIMEIRGLLEVRRMAIAISAQGRRTAQRQIYAS